MATPGACIDVAFGGLLDYNVKTSGRGKSSQKSNPMAEVDKKGSLAANAIIFLVLKESKGIAISISNNRVFQRMVTGSKRRVPSDQRDSETSVA
jgi:hypothetical protein